MATLPAPDLRSNLGTLAVPNALLPAVARVMAADYPAEAFDPAFRGQDLETYYLDTTDFTLRKARHQGDRYLTLRVRRYDPPGAAPSFALSAKTEDQKYRVVLPAAEGQALLAGGLDEAGAARYLPGALLARLLELAGDAPLVPVVRVCCRRYAVEDDRDRLTLDVSVRTDTGKCLPAGVLEFKSTAPDAPLPEGLAGLNLRPIRLSKFLWATLWR